MNAIQKDVNLKSFSTLKVGGRARFLVFVSTREELLDVMQFINDNNLPWYVLGFGSNVVLDDEFFDGVVLKLIGEFQKVSFFEDYVRCGAGFSLIKLGQILASKGFSGYEYMAVIPGSVGGGVIMNAGTTNQGVISDNFVLCSVLDPLKETIIEYKKKDMNFEHRYTALQNSKNIILDARFRLNRECMTNAKQIKSTIFSIRKQRLAKQPKIKRTFGSIFKRTITNVPAGYYLEKVGMKGFRLGDAMIPEEHSNWIINVANASAADVKAIVDVAQKRVFEKFGVNLEREVIYLPEDLFK
jgi:UDP-N-acetylmuramate dehydrogenase